MLIWGGLIFHRDEKEDQKANEKVKRTGDYRSVIAERIEV